MAILWDKVILTERINYDTRHKTAHHRPAAPAYRVPAGTAPEASGHGTQPSEAKITERGLRPPAPAASAQATREAQAPSRKPASHKPQAPGPWTLDKVSRLADRGAGLRSRYAQDVSRGTQFGVVRRLSYYFLLLLARL